MKLFLKIVVLLLAIVVLAKFGIKKIETKRAEEAKIKSAKLYPLVVKDMEVKLVDTTLTLPYLCEVQNDKDVVLSSKIVSRIVDIKQSGAKVKKGEVIATLDTTQIESSIKSTKNQLKASRISLENLRATHKRTKELLAVKGASIEQYQKEESSIAELKAKITSLEQKLIELNNNLSYAVIKSPVDGVIAKVMTTKGSVAFASKPIVKISANNGFYLLLRVPSATPVNGVIYKQKEYLAVSLESTYKGLYEYKVYPQDEKLVSGDRVEVDVITYKGKGILLPFDALLNKDSKSYVLVVEKNKAVPKEVSVVQSAKEGVVIKNSDLIGKRVVVAKPDILLKLTSGYPILIKDR
jgi:multidrug efflux pump subunit AcrA (membrane-fusion protein)